MHYFALIVAVIFETIGTAALEASAQFSKPLPVVVMLVAYVASFYFMALALKVMPVGVVYAIWSGLGMVLIAGAGVVLFNQRLDMPAILGLVLILAGVAVINLFSDTTHKAPPEIVKNQND